MRIFEDLVEDFKDLSGDSSTANETLGKKLLNIFIKNILAIRPWTFAENYFEVNSIQGVNVYPRRYNVGKVEGVKVQIDDVPYYPKEIISRRDWSLISRSSISGDVMQYFFINERGEIELYPTFSSSGHPITVYFQEIMPSRTATDYQTGTISRSAYSRTVTGSGTLFESNMIGRYIKDDGETYWSRIISVNSETVLLTAEECRSAVEGRVYKISEAVLLPIGFEDLPLWGALAIYYRKNEEPELANHWQKMYDKGLNDLERTDGKSTNNLLEREEFPYGLRNINDYPDSMAEGQ